MWVETQTVRMNIQISMYDNLKDPCSASSEFACTQLGRFRLCSGDTAQFLVLYLTLTEFAYWVCITGKWPSFWREPSSQEIIQVFLMYSLILWYSCRYACLYMYQQSNCQLNRKMGFFAKHHSQSTDCMGIQIQPEILIL